VVLLLVPLSGSDSISENGDDNNQTQI